jgi:predicted acetyltransferase
LLRDWPPTHAGRVPATTSDRASSPDVRIVRLHPEDRAELIRLDQAAFAFDPAESDAVGELPFLEWPRTWGAVRPAAGARRHAVSASWDEGEELAGQFTTFSLSLTVPGSGDSTRRTPMAGLSWVAVHPDHRRRGVLSAMMRHHLHGLHDAGEEPVAGLFASEAVIYQRFGYGEAAEGLSLRLPTGAALRPLPAAADVSTQLSSIDEDDELADLVEELFARTATRPGRVSRPSSATRELLRDRPWRHRDGEPDRIIVARRSAAATGYALLRRMPKWESGSPAGEVHVLEVVGDDAGTLHALWTRLLSFDLMSRVSTHTIGVDDPLVEWLVDIRSAQARREDGLWLRLVDVDRALTARGYRSDVDVVLEVKDELCPWNARRWRLGVAGDEVSCTATSDPPDLTVQVQDLAAAYLGGRSLASLELAGLVTGHRPGAVGALSTAMRGAAGPAVPQMF